MTEEEKKIKKWSNEQKVEALAKFIALRSGDPRKAILYGFMLDCLLDEIDKGERKINKQQSELKKKDKEIKEIRQKIHFKICSNCKEEFESKRSDAIYCKKCSKKVNNSNYYKNLNEEQKTIRREKAKEKMREIRKRRKVKDEN